MKTGTKKLEKRSNFCSKYFSTIALVILAIFILENFFNMATASNLKIKGDDVIAKVSAS